MRRADIFKVDGHQLVLDKEYIRGIPEFRTILERKIISEGDYDGRKKLYHWQLFFYIKLVGDMFCYTNMGGYGVKEVHQMAVKDAKLDPAYKPDDEIVAAIKKFTEIQLSLLPTLGTINNVLKGIRLSDKVSQTIIASIEAQLAIYERKIEEANKNGQTANAADMILLVNGLLDHLANLQKIAVNIPKTQEVLEKLEERLKKETAGDTVGRGGRSIGNRAEPTRK